MIISLKTTLFSISLSIFNRANYHRSWILGGTMGNPFSGIPFYSRKFRGVSMQAGTFLEEGFLYPGMVSGLQRI